MSAFWIFVILALGLVIMLMEVFIPSYGLLSIAGVGAFAASIYFGFQSSAALGVTVVILIVVLLPIEIVIGVKLFPETPLGRRMVLRAREKTTDVDRVSGADLEALVGREGVTRTMCRPAGVAEIGGTRVDVVAEGMIVDANRPVVVVRVDGNRVVVREK